MIPQPRTRFFGRGDDLAKLRRLSATAGTVVTVWGPPGIGKTRLAIELCRTRRDDARAWFCDLSAAKGERDVCAAVLSAIGAVPASHAVDACIVGDALSARGPGLLVLDNFEHLTRCAAPLVGAWLDAAPSISYVVTSRERTRLDGELTHEVLPLREEGVALFVDRSRIAAADHDAIATIVERLEGVPLAIELAAARVDVLGVDGLLARLVRPLDVLGFQGALQRAIDTSFRLLTEVEQRTLARCTVFRGPFSVEDAEAVISAEPGVAVLDVLQTLRDRSLLRSVCDGRSARFQLFETIRAHAAASLAESDETATRRRHAQRCIAAEAPCPTNLVEAVAFVLDDPTCAPELPRVIETIARIDPSMLGDPLVEQLGRALAIGETIDARILARGHQARGRALRFRGRHAEANADFARARELATSDAALLADLWIDAGLTHHQTREMDLARACYEEALSKSRETGDRVAIARCTGNIGALDHDARRFDAALARYEEAVATFQGAGERRLEGTFLLNTAILLQEMGSSPRARATYVLALERLAASGDHRLEAIAHTNFGMLCHELGELSVAREHHERALALLRRSADARSEGLCVGRLAMVLAAMGESAEAESCCARAERLLTRVADRVSIEVLELVRAYVGLFRGEDRTLSRERIARAQSPLPDVPSLVERSDDARTAARLIEAVLARDGAGGKVLVIGPDARWLVPPGGELLDLSARHVLRRLLLRLVEEHRARPGEGLTLDELRDAGWPGERLVSAAAANRIHVALAELRRRGLRTCLQRADARYFIDPSLRIDLRDV